MVERGLQPLYHALVIYCDRAYTILQRWGRMNSVVPARAKRVLEFWTPKEVMLLSVVMMNLFWVSPEDNQGI